jgi:hypothetical protein
LGDIPSRDIFVDAPSSEKARKKSGNAGSKLQSLIRPYLVVFPAMTWSLVSMQGDITDSNLRSTQDSSPHSAMMEFTLLLLILLLLHEPLV